jgi:hypothetical protein
MAASSVSRVPEITPMRSRDLVFDANNPRLRGDEGQGLSQQGIFDALWRDFAVDEVAGSIAANGYFEYEPMFVVKEGDSFVVVEGNRRLAAVKALIGEFHLSGLSVPKLEKRQRDQLETVPVMVATRKDLWEYIGFKHVNGTQAWRSASKASYIAWVHNELKVPLEEIARRIGDQHSTVLRFYRALMVLEQAEEADVFQRSDRHKEHFSFSHLYTGLDYAGVQQFLGIRPMIDDVKEPVPARKIGELGDLLLWLYGSRTRNLPALVQSQNPDLRILDDVLRTKNGVAALRKGLPLRVSQEIAKGDTQLLREALVSAKESLQTARGRVLTGYDGQSDLVSLANDIVLLADAIAEELLSQQRQSRQNRQKQRRGAASAAE